MAIRNASVPSLLDVVQGLNPDGSTAYIAEVLTRTNQMHDDMSWKQGNLLTGDRVTVRTRKPTVGWRRLNSGIPRSKGATTQVDEASALLEGSHQVDRELAVLAGNPAEYRRQQGEPFIESMNDEFAETLLYGNSAFNDTEFTGFMPRYNELANEQVIDAGGSGSALRSILLVGWHPERVTGIVPKGTTAGLQHIDATSNVRVHSDGYPIGDEVLDAEGRTYLAYKDRWLWRCGLSISDPRWVVRGANVDLDALSVDGSTGADLEDLMIQMEEQFGGGGNTDVVNAVFYAPRRIWSMLRRQVNSTKRSNTDWGEIGGKRVLMFGNIPVRRMDAMNVDEERVV